jgi:hypothetical protein
LSPTMRKGNPAFTRLSMNVFAERESSTVTEGFRSSSSTSAPEWSGSEWLTIT